MNAKTRKRKTYMLADAHEFLQETVASCVFIVEKISEAFPIEVFDLPAHVLLVDVSDMHEVRGDLSGQPSELGEDLQSCSEEPVKVRRDQTF